MTQITPRVPIMDTFFPSILTPPISRSASAQNRLMMPETDLPRSVSFNISVPRPASPHD